MFTTTIRGFLILTCVGLVSSSALAQSEDVYVKMTTVQLAETWLQRNCGTDDEPFIVEAITLRAAELTPVFRRSLETGPSAESVAEVEQAAAQRFERREAVLKEAPEVTGLAAEDLKRVQEQKRNAYVQRSRDNFVIGYRSQALAGLQIVDPEGTRGMLEQLANDSASPLQGTARVLLRREK